MPERSGTNGRQSLTARNRINQRNFRARRQNYIKDLEERLRKYESDGVQATIEIQTAARQVTEQNLRLRHLLTSRFSMSDSDIDAHIGITLTALPSAIFSSPLPMTKAFTDSKSVGFQPVALCPETSSPITDPASILSPALGLASLHRHPDPVSDSQHPSKRLKRNETSESSTSSAKLSDYPSQSAGGSNDSLITDQEQDTLSESSNPQTPGEFLDSALQHSSSQKQRLADFLRQTSALTTPRLSIVTGGIEAKRYSPDMFSQISLSRTPTDATCDFKSHHPLRPSHDETCEDAARIIASMRGSSVSGDEERPAQILLELGCRAEELEAMRQASSALCKAKTMGVN